MMVAEYQAEFIRLERFALGFWTIEADWVKRFQDGLDLNILGPIAAITFPTLATAVSAAT